MKKLVNFFKHLFGTDQKSVWIRKKTIEILTASNSPCTLQNYYAVQGILKYKNWPDVMKSKQICYLLGLPRLKFQSIIYNILNETK